MPTVDELFPEQQPSLDTLFPPEVEKERYRRQTLGTSPIQDLIFGDTSVNPIARVLDAFGQGAKQGWGADPNGLSEESATALKKAGVFNDYDKGQRSILKAANESLFRGAATYIADPIMRGLPAAFGGVQAAVAQVGEEAGQPKVGREAAAMFEAFPTGFRAATGAPGVGVAQLGREQHIRALEAEVSRARELGVIGAGEAGYAGTRPPEVAPPISGPQEAPKAAVEPVEQAAVSTPEPGLPAPEAPAVVERATPSPIAADVARRLEAAGRPADEARASGELIASHYEARAERFGGELGTAEELYKAEGARIRGPSGEAPELPKANYTKDASGTIHYSSDAGDGRLIVREVPASAAQSNGMFVSDYSPEAAGKYVAIRVRDNLQQTLLPGGGWVSKPEKPRLFNTAEEAEAAAKKSLGLHDGGEAPPPERKVVFSGSEGKPANPNQSLLDFLAREGGLKPTADLKQIFGDQNPTIPGAGKLFRKDGLTLDEALTRAKENSFILDPNDIQHTSGVENRGALTKSVNDLQDMIAEEAGGNKQYRNTRSAEPAKIDKDEEFHHIANELHRQIEETGGDPREIDPVTEKRVVEMIQKGEAPDVMTAYERAIMEVEYNQTIRPYINVPDSLMGFRRSGQNKGFDESNYSHVQPVKVTLEGGDAFHDSIKGMNKSHALERAWRNWPDAINVEPSELSLNQITRGKIRFPAGGKPIITLFKDANASTFIHETGHHWLEELMKDSEHHKAPAELRADADAVLKWLNVDTYHDIKVRHHEQFARGFERYMMEGKAPNQALAGVFSRFRDWLTRIYQSVTRLKSPINDEIRGVFDRLLTMKPGEVKIEPEGPAKSFADIHEADAISATPETAHPVAETIQAERDMLANQHIPEEHNARLEGIASEAQRREAGGPQPLRDGNEAARAAETGNNQAPGAVGEGGSVAPSEGAGASVGGGKTEAPVSPQARFEGPESHLVDKAGNIRLDNLGTAEDVNKAIRDAADQNNDFIEARRGVITDGQVLELADALGMDESKLSARKLGQAFNAEQIMAARKLLIQSATNVRDAMVKAAAGGEADILAYAETKARHQMIQEQVAGLTAEAGRALRAFRKLEGQQEAGAIGAFLKDATGKTLFQLQREAQLGMQLATPADVSKFVNDSSKPTWKDMVIEAWITALLSGPKTHVANVMGNTISGLARPIETVGAAAVGKIRNLVTGTQDRVLLGEAKAELFGMVQGAREGVVAAAKAFKTEEPQLTPVNQTERGHVRAIPSATVNILGREMEIGGKQARIPLRLLGAEDEFFKSVTFRGDINRQAYAIAAKENLPPEQFNMRVAELSRTPTEEMVNKAKDAAEYQTFQTPLGKLGRSIQNAANAHILVKFILPFVRTPLNLLKYAAERTPLGLFSQGVRDNLAGKNGAVARDTQISRIALGTMVGIATYELASQGLITGGGPADKSKKALMQADGWQDYSIRIGDMYYRYNRLDPFSVILGVVADAYEIYNASGAAHPDKEKIPSLVMAAITQNVLNRASLQGVSDLIQAVTDHERYGRNYLKKMSGTIVPALSAQSAQALDPVVHEARTVLDGIKARIPGLSQTLLPKRDVWGEPITREGGLGPDVASPIVEARMKHDPVNKALLDAGYYPGHLNRKIRGVELTDEQYDDYQRVAGRTAKVRLNAALNMISNPNIPATVRHDAIASIIKGSRETAASLVIMQSVNGENNIMKKATDAKKLKLQGESAH